MWTFPILSLSASVLFVGRLWIEILTMLRVPPASQRLVRKIAIIIKPGLSSSTTIRELDLVDRGSFSRETIRLHEVDPNCYEQRRDHDGDYCIEFDVVPKYKWCRRVRNNRHHL